MILRALLRAIVEREARPRNVIPTPGAVPVTVERQEPLPRDPALAAIYAEAGVAANADPVAAFRALSPYRQLQIIEAELVALPDHERRLLQEVLSADLDRAFIPNPGPQTAAYLSRADLLLYGGAGGGGKSAMLIGLAAQEHRRALILRRESTQLDGLVSFAQEVLSGRGDFNRVEREWSLSDRRSIKFGGMKDADSWRAYAGRARDLIGFDEAAEFLEEQVASLLAWLRSTDEGQRCRCVLASNPPRGAEGEWIVRWFAPWLDPAFPSPAAPGELRWFVRVAGEIKWVDGPDPVEVGGETYTPLSATFIPARLDDNPYLAGTNYRAQLQSLPEPLRSQLLKGDFLAGREDDAWQVIPSAWVDAAMERWSMTPRPNVPMTSLGVDVAQGGSDLTTLAPRYGKWFAELQVHKGFDTTNGPMVAALVFAAMRDHCQVVIDVGGGWGGSAYDHLSGQEIAVVGFNPSEGTVEKTQDGRLSFRNQRALAWWRFREALDPASGDGVCLPPDQALKADLTAPCWRLTPGGILVEAKEDIRKRLGRSTDRADAIIQAWMHGDARAAVRSRSRQTQANVGYRGAKRFARR